MQEKERRQHAWSLGPRGRPPLLPLTVLKVLMPIALLTAIAAPEFFGLVP